MKVLLATAYPSPWSYVPWFEHLAKIDRFGVHGLAASADDADIILFVDARSEHEDWRWSAIRSSRLYREHRSRSFIYDETDQPWCSLPGLYVAMPRRHFVLDHQRAFWYARNINEGMPAASAVTGCPDLLFSFLGRRCHACRDRVLRLRHPRAVIEDTSMHQFFGDSESDRMEQMRRYGKITARSKFVLCPRGTGSASFRLFETLAAGRVPVIVSDDWLPPAGPNWEALSIRVSESEVEKIPKILEESETNYERMADAVRRAYQDYIAPKATFHWAIEACADLLKRRRGSRSFLQALPSPRFVRLLLRSARHTVVQRLSGRRQANNVVRHRAGRVA